VLDSEETARFVHTLRQQQTAPRMELA
jgi:hypothetical protein